MYITLAELQHVAVVVDFVFTFGETFWFGCEPLMGDCSSSRRESN